MAPMKWRPKSLLAKKFKKKYKSNDSLPSVSSNNEQPEQASIVDTGKPLGIKASTLDRLLLRNRKKKNKKGDLLREKPLSGQDSTSSLVQAKEGGKEDLEESVKYQTVPRNFHSVRQRRRSSGDRKSCISAQNSLYFLHQELSSELYLTHSITDSFYHGILPRIDQKITISSTTPIKNFRMETKTYFDQIQCPEIANSEINTASYVIHNDDITQNDVMFEQNISKTFLSLPTHVPSSSAAPLVEMGADEAEPKPRKKKKKKKAKVQREFIEEEIIFVRLNVDGKEEIVRETVVRPISQKLDEKHIMQSAQNDNASANPSDANLELRKDEEYKRNFITSKCDTFPRCSRKLKGCDEICLNDFAAEVSKSVFKSENISKAKSEIILGDVEDCKTKEIHENIILILVNDRAEGTKFVLKPRQNEAMAQNLAQPLFVDTEQRLEDKEIIGTSPLSSSTTSGSQTGKRMKMKKKRRRRILKEIEWIEEEIILIRIDDQGNEHYVKEIVRRPSRASLVESMRRSRKKPIPPSDMPDPCSLGSQNVPTSSLERRNDGCQDWFEEKVLVSNVDEFGKKGWVPKVVRRPSLPAIAMLGRNNSFETSSSRPPFVKSSSTEANLWHSIDSRDFYPKSQRGLAYEDVAECSEVASEVTTECSEIESEYNESVHSFSIMNESQILESDELISDEEIYPLTIFNNESSYRGPFELSENNTREQMNNHQKMCNAIRNGNQVPISGPSFVDVFHSDDEEISVKRNLEVGEAFQNFRRPSQEHETDDFNSDSHSATPEPRCSTVQASPVKNQSCFKIHGNMQIELANAVQNLNHTNSAQQNQVTNEWLESFLKQQVVKQSFKAVGCSGASNALHGFSEDSVLEVEKRLWAEEINISKELLASKYPLGQRNMLASSVSESNNLNTRNANSMLGGDLLVCGKFLESVKLDNPPELDNGTTFNQPENENQLKPDYNISYLVSALDLQSPFLAKLSIPETVETDFSVMDCTCTSRKSRIIPQSFGLQFCAFQKEKIFDENFSACSGHSNQRMHHDQPVEQCPQISCDQCVQTAFNESPSYSYNHCDQAVNALFCTECSFISQKNRKHKSAFSHSSYVPLTRFHDDMNENFSHSRRHGNYFERPHSDAIHFKRHFSTSKSLFYSTNCLLHKTNEYATVPTIIDKTYPNSYSNIQKQVDCLGRSFQMNVNPELGQLCQHSWLKTHGNKMPQLQQCHHTRKRHSFQAKTILRSSTSLPCEHFGRNSSCFSYSLPRTPNVQNKELALQYNLNQKNRFSSPIQVEQNFDHPAVTGNPRWADDSRLEQKVERVLISTSSTTTSPFIQRRRRKYKNQVAGFASQTFPSVLGQSLVIDRERNDSKLEPSENEKELYSLIHTEEVNAGVRSFPKRLSLEILPSKLLPERANPAELSPLSVEARANPLSPSLGKICVQKRSTLTGPNKFRDTIQNSDTILNGIDVISQSMKKRRDSTEMDLFESAEFIPGKVDSQSVTSETLKSGDLLEESLVSESSKTSSLSKLNSTTGEVVSYEEQEESKKTENGDSVRESSTNGAAASKILLTSFDVTSSMFHSISKQCISNGCMAHSKFCNDDDSDNKVVASQAEKTKAIKTFTTTIKPPSAAAVVRLSTTLQNIEAPKWPKRDFSGETKTGFTSNRIQTESSKLTQGLSEVGNAAAESKDSEVSSEEPGSSIEVENLDSVTQNIRSADVEITEDSAVVFSSSVSTESSRFETDVMVSPGGKDPNTIDENASQIVGSYSNEACVITGCYVEDSRQSKFPISMDTSVEFLEESDSKSTSEVSSKSTPLSTDSISMQNEICDHIGQLVCEDKASDNEIESTDLIVKDENRSDLRNSHDDVLSEDPLRVKKPETEKMVEANSKNTSLNLNSRQLSAESATPECFKREGLTGTSETQRQKDPDSVETALGLMDGIDPECRPESFSQIAPILTGSDPTKVGICAENGENISKKKMTTVEFEKFISQTTENGESYMNGKSHDNFPSGAVQNLKVSKMQTVIATSGKDIQGHTNSLQFLPKTSTPECDETVDASFETSIYPSLTSEVQRVPKLAAKTATKNFLTNPWHTKPGLQSSSKLTVSESDENVENESTGNLKSLCLDTEVHPLAKSAAVTEENNFVTNPWNSNSTEEPPLLQSFQSKKDPTVEEKNDKCRNVADVHTESPLTNDLCHLQISFSETPPSSVSEPESYKWAFPVKNNNSNDDDETNLRTGIECEIWNSCENHVFEDQKRLHVDLSDDNKKSHELLFDELEAQIVHAANRKSPISFPSAEVQAFEESSTNFEEGLAINFVKVTLSEDSETYKKPAISPHNQLMTYSDSAQNMLQKTEFPENNLDGNASHLKNTHTNNSIGSIQKSSYLLGQVTNKEVTTAVNQKIFDSLTQQKPIPLEKFDISETFPLLDTEEVEQFEKHDQSIREYGDISSTGCSEPSFLYDSNQNANIGERSLCRNDCPIFDKVNDLSLETVNCLESSKSSVETIIRSCCLTNDVILTPECSSSLSDCGNTCKPVEFENSVSLKISGVEFNPHKASMNGSVHHFCTPRVFEISLEAVENNLKSPSCYASDASSAVEPQLNSEIRKTKPQDCANIKVKEVANMLKLCGSKIGQPDTCLSFGSAVMSFNLTFKSLQVLESPLIVTLSQDYEKSSILQKDQERNFGGSAENALHAMEEVLQKCSLEIAPMPRHAGNYISSVHDFPNFSGQVPLKALSLPNQFSSGTCVQLESHLVEAQETSEASNLLVCKQAEQTSQQHDQSLRNYGDIMKATSEPRFGCGCYSNAIIGNTSWKLHVYPVFDKVTYFKIEIESVNSESLKSLSSLKSSLKSCEGNDVIVLTDPGDLCETDNDVFEPVKNESSIVLKIRKKRIQTNEASTMTSTPKFSTLETMIKNYFESIEVSLGFYISKAALIQSRLNSDPERKKSNPEDSCAMMVKEVDSKLKLRGVKSTQPDACYLIGSVAMKELSDRFELLQDLPTSADTPIFSLATETAESEFVKATELVVPLTVNNKSIHCFKLLDNNCFDPSNALFPSSFDLNSVQNKPQTLYGRKLRGQVSIANLTSGQVNNGKFHQCEEFVVYYEHACILQLRMPKLAKAHTTSQDENCITAESFWNDDARRFRQNDFKFDLGKNANHETHDGSMNRRRWHLVLNEQNSNDDKNLIKNNPVGNFIVQGGEFDLSANKARANEKERSRNVHIYPSIEVLKAFSFESEGITSSVDTNVTRILPDESEPPTPEAQKVTTFAHKSNERATKKEESLTHKAGATDMSSFLAVAPQIMQSLTTQIEPDRAIIEVKNENTGMNGIDKMTKTSKRKEDLAVENSPTNDANCDLRPKGELPTSMGAEGVSEGSASFKGVVPETRQDQKVNTESSEVSSHLNKSGFDYIDELQKNERKVIPSRGNDQTLPKTSETSGQSKVDSKGANDGCDSRVTKRNADDEIVEDTISEIVAINSIRTNHNDRSGNEKQVSKEGNQRLSENTNLVSHSSSSPGDTSTDNVQIDRIKNPGAVESEDGKPQNLKQYSDTVNTVSNNDEGKENEPTSVGNCNDGTEDKSDDSGVAKSNKLPPGQNFVGSSESGANSSVSGKNDLQKVEMNMKFNEGEKSSNRSAAVQRSEQPKSQNSCVQNAAPSSTTSPGTSCETVKTKEPPKEQSSVSTERENRNQPNNQQSDAQTAEELGPAYSTGGENNSKESDATKPVVPATKKRLSSSPLRSRSRKHGSGSLERPRAKRKYKERRRNLTPMSRIDELSERQSASNDEAFVKSKPRPTFEVLPVMPRNMIISCLPGLQSIKFDEASKLDSGFKGVSVTEFTPEVHVASEASPAVKKDLEDSINKYKLFSKPDEGDIFAKLDMLKVEGNIPSLKPEEVVRLVRMGDHGAFPGKKIDKQPVPEILNVESSDEKLEEKIACTNAASRKSLKEKKGALSSNGIHVRSTNRSLNVSQESREKEPASFFIESNDSLNLSDYKVHLSAYASSLDSYSGNFDPAESQMLDDLLEDLNVNFQSLNSFDSLHNFQSLASLEGTKNDDLFQVSDNELQYPTQSSPILDNQNDRPRPFFSSIEPLSRDLVGNGMSLDWSKVGELQEHSQNPKISGGIQVKETFVRNYVISLPLTPKIHKKVLKRTAGQSSMSEAVPLKSACLERIECQAGYLMAPKDASVIIQRAPKRPRRNKDTDYSECNQQRAHRLDSRSRRSRTTSFSSIRPKTSESDFSAPVQRSYRYDERSAYSNVNQLSPENSGFISVIPVSVTSDETKVGQASPKLESSSSNNQNLLSSTFNSKSRESGYKSEQQERAKRFQEAGKLFFRAPRLRKIEEQEGTGIFIDDEMYSKPPSASALWKYNDQKRYKIQRGDWTRDSNSVSAASDDVIKPEPSMRSRMCSKAKGIGRRLLKYWLLFMLLYFLKFLITNDYFFDYTCRSREFLTTKSTGLGPH